MIKIWVLAPREDLTAHAPSGMIFSDEVFREARLRDEITLRQRAYATLQRDLAYLQRRFPRRLRIQWVTPWSLAGLWLSIRYHVHHPPAVLIADGQTVHTLHEDQISTLKNVIIAALARVPHIPTEEGVDT